MQTYPGRVVRALHLAGFARELAIGAVICIALGFMSGGWVTSKVLGTRLAEAKAEHEQQQRVAVEAALKRSQIARAAGDQAQAALATALAANTQLTEERNHAISSVTTGRACLRGAALRVLDGAPGLRVAGLPPATAGTAAADASVAADPFPASAAGPERIVTDTDLARWSLTAGNQYEQCRRRLDALIDFSTATTSAPTPALATDR